MCEIPSMGQIATAPQWEIKGLQGKFTEFLPMCEQMITEENQWLMREVFIVLGSVGSRGSRGGGREKSSSFSCSSGPLPLQYLVTNRSFCEGIFMRQTCWEHLSPTVLPRLWSRIYEADFYCLTQFLVPPTAGIKKLVFSEDSELMFHGCMQTSLSDFLWFIQKSGHPTFFTSQQHLIFKYYLILLYILLQSISGYLQEIHFITINHPILLKEFWVLLLIIVRGQKSGLTNWSKLAFYTINLASEADPGCVFRQ